MSITRTLFLTFVFTSISYGAMPCSILPNTTGDLCPSRDICIWKAQREVEYDVNLRLTSCCEDCSCDRSCGEDRTCCFPELDITNGAKMKYKSCVETRVPELGYTMAYLMVDSNPDGGCIVDVPDMPTGEQCGNVAVAWWGTLFPAYSQSKKTIYKNKLCAQCHNATDARLFEASLISCPLEMVNQALSSNGKALASIFQHPIFIKCHVSFTLEKDFKKPEHSIEGDLCYVDIVNICPTEFSVPVNIDLDKNEIKRACVSGLFSPYETAQTIYSNVFCALCNDINTFGTTMCPVSSKDSKSFNTGYYILLDLDKIEAIQATSTQQHSDIETACRSVNDKVECRRLFCPTGMIRLNGECTFISKKTYGYPYIVVLSLIPDTNVDIQITHLQQEIRQNKIVIRSVWSKKWWIFKMLVKDTTYYSNNTVVEELVIGLEYRPKQIFPGQLLQLIENNLKHNHIVLSVGNETFKFRQTMARFYRLYYSEQRFSLFGADSIENKTILENVLNEFVYIEVGSSHFGIYNGQVEPITYTYFCNQIQLKEDEYVLSSPYAVYYKTQDKYLLDGQFSEYTGEYGEQVVRICLSETDFMLASGASSNLKTTELIFKLEFILVIRFFLIYFN